MMLCELSAHVVVKIWNTTLCPNPIKRSVFAMDTVATKRLASEVILNLGTRNDLGRLPMMGVGIRKKPWLPLSKSARCPASPLCEVRSGKWRVERSSTQKSASSSRRKSMIPRSCEVQAPRIPNTPPIEIAEIRVFHCWARAGPQPQHHEPPAEESQKTLMVA